MKLVKHFEIINLKTGFNVVFKLQMFCRNPFIYRIKRKPKYKMKTVFFSFLAHSEDLTPRPPAGSTCPRCWPPAGERCSPSCRFCCTSSRCGEDPPPPPPETDLWDGGSNNPQLIYQKNAMKTHQLVLDE